MSEIWNLSTICRCCHSDGNFKSLREPYRMGDEIVIYESMLRDVLAIAIFQLTTATFEASYIICDQCIQRLHDAANFKQQVLECEQKFHVYCKNEQFLTPPIETVVKVEGIVKDLKDDVHNDGVINLKNYTKCAINLKKEYKIEMDLQTEVPSDDIDSCGDTQDGELWKEVKIEKEIELEAIKKVANKNVSDEQTYQLTHIKHEKDKPKEGYTLIQSNRNGKATTYMCTKCPLKIENRDTIKKHIFNDHKEVLSYECELCHKVFLTKKSYSSHMTLHKSKRKIDKDQTSHDVRNSKILAKLAELTDRKSDGKTRQFQCDLCKKHYLHRSTLKKHMKLHYGTSKEELCELCGRGFNDRSNLRIHIDTVHKKLRLYGCDMCGRSFTAKKHVKAHIIAHMYGRDHQTTKRYQCDRCTKQFTQLKSLKWHQYSHENKYPCSSCNKIFDDVTDYKTHKRAHTEIKYSCNICNRNLSSTYTLNRHLDGHNGIRRFPCDKCPLKFIDKAQLKRHISRIHDPNNPGTPRVQCMVCKRLVRDIAKHMPSHEFKKFSCIYCSNSYVENKSLKRHIQAMHFGKVYTCGVCNKNVISLSSLARHKRRVHKIFKSENYNGDGLNNGSEVLDIEYTPMG